MIKLFQEWRFTAWMPPNLHAWEKFITPDELRSVLARMVSTTVRSSGSGPASSRRRWSGSCATCARATSRTGSSVTTPGSLSPTTSASHTRGTLSRPASRHVARRPRLRCETPPVHSTLVGFGLGFLVALQLGPMSLFLVRSTLRGGWRVGIAIGAGIAAVDGLYAAAGSAGIAPLLGVRPVRLALGLTGAAVLLWLGARTLRWRATPSASARCASPTRSRGSASSASAAPWRTERRTTAERPGPALHAHVGDAGADRRPATHRDLRVRLRVARRRVRRPQHVVPGRQHEAVRLVDPHG